MISKKFFIGMTVLLSASLFFLGCPTGNDEETTEPTNDQAVSSAVLDLTKLVNKPDQGKAAGDGSIKEDQYTGTITWNPAIPSDGNFAASTTYTATVALAATEGFTFKDVPENSFPYAGAKATNPKGTDKSLTVTIVFPITLKADGSKNVVDATDLTALVTTPMKNAAPDTNAIDAPQYTGAIAWKDSTDAAYSANFVPNAVYKAEVTLAAKEGYTFDGVGLNTFAYDLQGATVTNPAGTASGVTVTIVFPATAGTAADPGPVNATTLTNAIVAPVTGAVADSVFTTPDSNQYTGSAVEWTPAIVAGGKFAGATPYKATVTLTVKEDYTFAGLAADAFSYVNAAVVFNADTRVVEVTFGATDAVVSSLNLAAAIVAPVTGNEPSDVFTTPAAAQYDGSKVAWTPAVANGETFAADTAYKAAVTLTAEDGYTFATLTNADFSASAGATVAFDVETGIVEVTYAKTAAVVSVVDLSALIVQPVKNAIPTALVDAAQYSGVVTWKDDSNKPAGTQFAAATGYKAEVTLAPAAGFTFVGFAGGFIHANGTVTQGAVVGNTVTVTVDFTAGKTAASETTVVVGVDPLTVASSTGSLEGITLTKGGTNVTLTVSSDFSFTGTKWYVDGNPTELKAADGVSNDKFTLTLDPAKYGVRAQPHHVTVSVSISGKPYSVTVPFKVVAAN
ncbi:MAG: hypothetical protein LBK61_09500 [Spirochaetaceae bacterium]|jgi:hypothetical protein|nr:hypothetical protein [Spirochaetaceae bacterium]